MLDSRIRLLLRDAALGTAVLGAVWAGLRVSDAMATTPLALVGGWSWADRLLLAIAFTVVALALWQLYAFRQVRTAASRDLALVDALGESIVVCSGLQILSANRAFRNLLGIHADAIPGSMLTKYLPDVAAVERLMSDAPVELEIDILDHASQPITVSVRARSIEHQGTLARLLEIRDVRKERESRERISFLAHHDGLTRLPNRRVLTERLEAAIERSAAEGHRCAIAWIDLDRFKMINDVFGHGAGDMLLRSLAERLRFEMPPDAVIARMGGDEFMVLIEEIDDPTEVRLIGQQLRRLLNKPVEIDGMKLDCGASVGTAVYPEHGATAEELMRNADLALYEAKAEGRGRCRHFTPAMAETLERRLILARDMKEAIERAEIVAYFQPVVRSSDYEIVGFEALARWAHPELGTISPVEFIRIAEENALVGPLAELMIGAAIDAAQTWPDHVRVAVNISPVQLNRDFVEAVRTTLRARNFEPSRIEIEVTEDALIHDFDQAASVFARLREFGVQVAMDDFGAGFTSLNNLKRLNFDRVKLDRSIVQDVAGHRRAAAIVRSLFVLARELGIGLTVEGVETAAELDHLRAEGECEVQGYLFSRPQPLEYWADFAARSEEIRQAHELKRPRSNVIRHFTATRRRSAQV